MKIKILQCFIAHFILAGCTHADKTILAPEFVFGEENLHVITSGFNRRKSTNFTLYGNAIAINNGSDSSRSLLPGQVYKLVTWKQKPNPYWFGGYINDEILTIEILKVSQSGNRVVQTDYHVENSKKEILHRNDSEKQSRIKFIREQKASVFP
ncbi:hypothetical protein L0657_22050 [Dyadobacter sp. CY345]|uniref:hypothetical protein n=1 Tax=Dyadobacter sp. CY345 TaxID=2909335 RepID=UPI001F417F67|nr:hypothetical protein [Dyadobacter sp. CY345]MCF2446656.1 hypothetical protein [Dyadobacter sp. CY345]